MAGESAVPLLPSCSIDETVEFYEHLGFAVTYRQERPYSCAGLHREGLDLQFFGMPEGFEPEDSYGSCLVLTADVEGLHRAFADGLRAAYGKVPVRGFPRMTRPRRKQGGFGGFSVVDPSGNWLRVTPAAATEDAGDAPRQPRSRLARALEGAARIGDSKGDEATAARTLDRALAQEGGGTPVERAEVLAYRAELAVRLGDEAHARELIAAARALVASAVDRPARLACVLGDVSELDAALVSGEAADRDDPAGT